MATNDPVLDRPMFQPRGTATKSKGIAAVQTDDTPDNSAVDVPAPLDAKSRKEQAAALVDAAKQKFDPSNFQTLTDQERPEVFRPTAVNVPAAAPAQSTTQKMQQMAAQGVQQPVQMATGGLAYAEGGLHSAATGPESGPYGYSQTLGQLGLANDPAYQVNDYNLPSSSADSNATLSPTVASRFRKASAQLHGVGSLAPATKDTTHSVDTTDVASTPYSDLDPDPSKWSDDDINSVAQKVAANSAAGGNKAGTRAGRGLQSLVGLPTNSAASDIANSLRQEREMAIQNQKTAGSDQIPQIMDTAAKAEGIKAANPVPGLFDPSTEQSVAAAQSAQTSALSQAEADRIKASQTPAPAATPTAAPAEGIKTLPSTDVTTPATPAAAPATPVAAPVAAPAPAAATPDGSDGSYSFQAPNAQFPLPAAPAASSTDDTTSSATSGAGIGSLPDRSASGGLTLEGIKAERAAQRQDNINLALMQAGLAIAGGRSANALTNIGEGGMQGVQMYAKGEQEARQFQRDQMADLRAQQQAAAERDYRNATLGISGQQLALTAAGQAQTAKYQTGSLAQQQASLNQSLDEFNQNLELKKQEFANNIQVAIANRDATLAKTTTENITSQLNNLESARSRIASNVQMNVMSPDQAKAQLDRYDRMEASLRAQANALSSMTNSRLGITPPAASATDTSGWKYLGASTGAQ